jgi:uncharacterized protein (TIGR02246 family)
MNEQVTNPDDPTRADRHAMKGVLNNYKLTAETNDFESWLELWDENGCRMAPDSPPAVGLDQIREQMAPNFAKGIENIIDINFMDAHVEGSFGYIRSDGSINMTFPDDKTFSTAANVLTVFKRQDDKSWKIYIDCFNFYQS